ncbi:TrkA family potassium uptake protein [Jeotgalibaca porci]|uniref:TrkA family potassium uptake protein n=1 Tax=Jeotgalibaca porci TaxID=1868793 RepID=A0A6G7WHV5_9LACT|nr:TrkA family potassium uptake protein [Jeotgalibaca porci]QIK51833.1 TrkA family potassium uptake protein [Jeotgalibaca porci]
MSKLIGILGLGIFGSTIAKTLSEFGSDVIAVDKYEENVNRIEPYIAKGVVGDFTDIELLRTIGLEDCDAVVIATGTYLEASVLGVLNCKKLGIKHIIAKAKNKNYREVLEEIGSTIVVQPEKESGVRVAKNLLRTNIEDIVRLDDSTSVVEFYPPERWIGKSLIQLDLRRKYDINIIGMRRNKLGKLVVSFDPNEPIAKDFVLVGITESDKFEQVDYLNQLN